MVEPTFTITELSREFGITPRAIRHYEEQGLLAPTREGQQRVYSKRDRTRLKLTLRGKRLGLTLTEIKELINMYDTAPDQSSQLVKGLTALAERRAALEQQREDIAAVLAELDIYERQWHDILAEAGVASSSNSRRCKKA